MKSLQEKASTLDFEKTKASGSRHLKKVAKAHKSKKNTNKNKDLKSLALHLNISEDELSTKTRLSSNKNGYLKTYGSQKKVNESNKRGLKKNTKLGFNSKNCSCNF